MAKAHVYKRDHINTDEIIPARYLNTDDEQELAGHCLEDLDRDFVRKVKAGDVIVAGKDFGCGSSREHAVWAIRGAKVATVIAKSFARIFYRNAIDCGFYLIESAEAVDKIDDGDEVEIDYKSGLIKDKTSGINIEFSPLPDFALEIIKDGGLLEHIKNQKVMTAIRKKALDYLRKKGLDFSEDMAAASKLYEPEESWTTRRAWWFDLPVKRIQEAPDEHYYLVCEFPPKEYVVLRIPNRFLLENLSSFDTKTENVLRLHIAAYPDNWLVDERVKNGVDFARFEIK